MKLQDSCAKILDILGRKPDLVIGNYTDGNLVAYLVSRKLGVTQVKIPPLQYTINHAMQCKAEPSPGGTGTNQVKSDKNKNYHISINVTGDDRACSREDEV